MGLLDGLENMMGTSWDDPKTAAMFAGAQGLLGGRTFMGGLLGGTTAYTQSLAEAKKRQQAEQLQGLLIQQHQSTLDQAKRQSAHQAKQEEFRMSIPSPQLGAAQTALAGGGGPTLANAALMPQIDPNAQLMHGALQAGLMSPMDYINSQRKDNAPKYMNVAAGGTVFDERSGKPVYTAPKEDALPSAVKEYQFAQQQGFPGTFQQFQLGLKKAGASNISVENRFENEYSKNQGKSFSDLMGDLNRSAFSAPTQVRKLERMTQLLDGVDGGKLAPVGLEVASALNSLGVKVDPRLGNKEGAEALARELAGGLRQPGTGPMTDKDFDNFLTQVPSLSKSGEGRKQITATMKAALNRDMAVAKLAREYARKHGQIDNNFLDLAATFIAENPVVAAPANWKVQR